jgi:AAA15 family ATPase/GTPase
MLIEFRLRNFRSFKGESALSMVASSDKTLADTNTLGAESQALPRVVRSAVLYGSNASGKSNFLIGLQLMRGLVVESASLLPNQHINYQPFKLDRESASQPTLFEATFAIGGIRYQYGFEFTQTRVMGEWLLVYQKPKAQRWFERKFDAKTGKDVFEFGTHLTGAKKTWQEATRPNALFLSTAVQLNSELLAPIYAWFAQTLNVVLDGGQLPFEFSTNMVRTEAGQAKIASLLSSADIAIASISAHPTKGFRQQFQIDPLTGATNARTEELEILMPKFRHVGKDITQEFELGEESQGTQKLFSLAGPIFDILENGRVLVVDELDRSLHPLLVRQIIKAFQDPKLNCHGAQLIFSTHDTSQLSSGILRRDQVWLTEKLRDQSSELVALTTFSARKEEALEKNYLGGRYGAVPILADSLLTEGVCGEG